MVTRNLELPMERIAEVCHRYPVRQLSVFGSVLRDDFTPESDVDMLVEFEPGARVSLFDLVEMELDLSDLLGRKVDLNTLQCLSRYFRDEVVAEAEAIYVKT
jgi:predicted nucleotidyltransferase